MAQFFVRDTDENQWVDSDALLEFAGALGRDSVDSAATPGTIPVRGPGGELSAAPATDPEHVVTLGQTESVVAGKVGAGGALDAALSSTYVPLETYAHTLTVKTAGGDFSNLSAAVAAVTNSSRHNRYLIEIHEGTYDVFSTLTPAELAGAGIVLPNFVDLLGVGDVWLKGELPNDTTYALSAALSTLNVYRTNRLTNLRITAKNCRYAVHSDSSGLYPDGEIGGTDLRIEHFGYAPGLWNSAIGWGEGTSPGGRFEFDRCSFSGAAGYTSHNNTAFAKGTTHTFRNCHFEGSAFATQWISLNSGRVCRVAMDGCTFDGDILLTLSAGETYEYKITGAGGGDYTVATAGGAPAGAVTILRPFHSDAWVPLTLINSWATYYTSASCRRDAVGRVRLRGLIAGGAAGSVCAILPEGYRPTQPRSFPLPMSSGQTCGVVEVDPEGNITCKTSGDVYSSLDCIDFDTD